MRFRFLKKNKRKSQDLGCGSDKKTGTHDQDCKCYNNNIGANIFKDSLINFLLSLSLSLSLSSQEYLFQRIVFLVRWYFFFKILHSNLTF